MTKKGCWYAIALSIPAIVVIGIIAGPSHGDLVVKREVHESAANLPKASKLIKTQMKPSPVLCPISKDIQKITEDDCITTGCIWIEEELTDDASLPKCFLPPSDVHGYYTETEEELPDGELRLRIKLMSTSVAIFPLMKEYLDVQFIPYGDDMFRIKIIDPQEDRYEVPVPLNIPKKGYESSRKYDVTFSMRSNNSNEDFFVIKVRRKGSGNVLFDTSIGGFTFANQFLEISTILPSDNLFGLGENSHYGFRHDLLHKTWPMFARDEGPKKGEYNLYGSHPVYYVLENDGNCHAVFWLNSNAMEAETLPTPGLTLRAIGGVVDLFFFMGPLPSEAASQYTKLVGRPLLPPYWSLGFQLCRYGYENLDEIKAVMLRTKRHGIPQDIQYADIDHMEKQKVFTVDRVSTEYPGLPSLVKEIKEDGRRFIVILDPAINVETDSYETHQRALKNDVYIKWFNESFVPSENFGMGDVMLGYVWPENRTAFPDWFKSRTQQWWMEEIRRFHDVIEFDGLWIDMNEPANFGTNLISPWNWPESRPPWSLFCPESTWDDPPYPTKASRINGEHRISDKTICMVGVQGESNEFLHYDVHNLYGWSQTLPTRQGLQNVTGKRGIVISRSTFPSSGKWAGHWLGDNSATWEDLRASITGLLEFNLFGIPYVGADICGFFMDTSEELCLRWMQLGAFYPFARNHNSKGFIDQDPGRWPSVAESGREVLRLRYLMLPYLYTLHYLATTEGQTVVRPLFFEYSTDFACWSIDDQFMWGPSLMIAPIVTENTTSRSVYFPQGIWYSYPKGNSYKMANGSNVNVLLSDRNDVPVFVRGGSVIVTQRPALNTEISRKNPLGLVVAPDMHDSAQGNLFWDDGESIDTIQNLNYFKATVHYEKNKVYWKLEKEEESLQEGLRLSDIVVFNVEKRPKVLLLNDERSNAGDWHYDPRQKVLQIFDLNIKISENFSIGWQETFEFKLQCPVSFKGGRKDGDPVSEEMCLPACICNSTESGLSHHLPSNSQLGYRIDGEKILTKKGFQIPLMRTGADSLFGDDVIRLKFEVLFYSASLLRFKFTDYENDRYEVPISLTLPSENFTETLYELRLESERVGDPFAFYAIRKDTGTILFDTRIGGFVYSNQFLSVSTFLPSKNVYGFGENNHKSFRHSLSGRIWPMFSRDQSPLSHQPEQELNLYGVHPFYEVQENDGKSHGVFLLNSNAIDYQLLDIPALTIRTIGGILDFFLFSGPSPEDVIKQYTNLIHRPVMPPYWALGFQQSRYGYQNTAHIEQVLSRTRFYEIPHDVQYVDINYMDQRKDFTLDEQNFGDLPRVFDEIRSKGMRTIVILNSAINAQSKVYCTHERAQEADAYIKWPRSSPLEAKRYNNPDSDVILGYVWPDNKTAFPNWHKVSTQQWWEDEIIAFHSTSLTFDGLWIDMNEPALFDTNLPKPWNWPENRPPWNLKCPKNQWDDPPYITKAGSIGPSSRMSDKTLCMIAEEEPFRHYDSHNLYGWAQTEPSLRAMRKAIGERSLVISRSTFAGSGQWGGHWLGNNAATWEDLRRSIIGILEFNLFGIPYVGADICGYFGDAPEELCLRWMQLGAFYPFSRSHNGKDFADQDPGMWPSVAQASKRALNIRYSLLPYLYTLFYEAHTSGGTVARPLHHEFPQDRETYGIDSQFLWGPALMISPVLGEGQRSRDVYFPLDFWYDFLTGKPVEWPGERTSLKADLNQIPIHVRGGFILPMQAPANNTKQSRLNPMSVLVALNASRQAQGSLFWDDGHSIDTIQQNKYDLVAFQFDQDIFTMVITSNVVLISSLKLSEVTIYGIENEPTSVFDNGQKLDDTKWVYDRGTLKLSLFLNKTFATNMTLAFSGIWQ